MRLSRPIAAATCLLLATSASADEVVLKDGSRLQGTVVRMDDAGLVFATGFAGELTIAADAVATVTTDNTAVVQLDSGDQLVGRLAVAGDTQVVESASLGTIPLADDSIDALWQQGDQSPAERALADQLATEATDWSGSLSAGITGSSGTKDRSAGNARVEAEMSNPGNLLSLYLDGRYAEENGDETENEIRLGGRLEHDISGRFFSYGEVDLERDGVEELELRTTVTSGIGYTLIDNNPVHSWKVRAGVGFENESFESGDSTTELVVSLGYTWKRKFADRFTAVHELEYLPSIDDPGGDYRLNSRLALELPMGKDDPWMIKMGVKNQYDAMPQPGVEELDTTWFVNLGYDFD